MEASGAIKPIQVDGRAIATLPRNPAQAAAEQQEVGMAVKAIQILGQAFPEEFKMYIDGAESIKAILDKMRVTLLKMRKPEEVKAAVAQMTQLAGARHIAGAPDQPPGPAA